MWQTSFLGSGSALSSKESGAVAIAPCVGTVEHHKLNGVVESAPLPTSIARGPLASGVDVHAADRMGPLFSVNKNLLTVIASTPRSSFKIFLISGLGRGSALRNLIA